MAEKMNDICPMCDEAAVERLTMTQQFAYADGGRDVLLTADIPVEVCTSCDEVFVGPEGESARHGAVCSYLGRLAPLEIKKLRETLGLSQEKFAKKINVGIASVKRWETGAVIQSKAMDELLRSVGKDDTPLPRAFTPVFRTEIKEYMLANAKQFRLRPGM